MKFTALIDRLAHAASLIATLCLVAITLSITADAIGRYVLSHPIAGVHAVVGGLLQPAMIFLGAALVARGNGHMRVEVLPLNQWPALKRAIEAVFAWLIAAFWGIVSWQAAVRAHEAYVQNQWPVGEIAIPTIVSYSVVAIGAALAAVAHLLPSRDEHASLD